MSSTANATLPVTQNTQTTPQDRPRLDLSASALLAGALAAITSAVLGAQLSTAGTIIGAGVGSLIGAVATALYRWWLLRTHSVVKSLVVRRGGPNASDANPDELPLPGLESTTAAGPATATHTPAPAGPLAPTGPLAAVARWLTPARAWTIAGVVASAAAAFALALVLITGFESARGTSLSGQQGTTIGVVAEQRNSGSTTDAAPAAASATPTPSATATPQASGSASATPTPTADATPTPATGGSATAAPSASPQPAGTSSAPTAQPSG